MFFRPDKSFGAFWLSTEPGKPFLRAEVGRQLRVLLLGLITAHSSGSASLNSFCSNSGQYLNCWGIADFIPGAYVG